MTCACESIHPFPCQFGEQPVFPFAGKDWCRFHLPLQNAAGNKSAKGRGDDGWKTRYVGLLSPGNTNGPIGGIKKGKELEAFRTEVHARLQVKKPTSPNPLLAPDSRADLRGVVFPPGFAFGNIGIEHALHVNFEGATFGDHANFRDASIDDEANFTGVTFDDSASFDGATLGKRADFTRATFGGRASFGGMTFGNEANFYRATFCFKANFKAATFGNMTRFERATFEGYADFSDASFGVGADFTQAIFKDVADFSDTSPAPNPNIPHRDLALRFISFRKALFNGQAIFENRAFATSSLFDGAIFENLAQFHGCKFHQGMFFHQADFRKTIGGNNTQTAELEQSYRTLKRAMADLHARNEEADFFALEMECRRQRGSVSPFERFAATAYKHLADYGRSIVRPVAWLLPLTVFAFLFYRDFGAIPGATFRDGSEILEFTLEQMFSPFKVWFSPSEGKVVHKAVGDLLSQYPPLVKILASLQSLGTIGLLTLFLLALRRRFKMD
jgi:hypothetical protein